VGGFKGLAKARAAQQTGTIILRDGPRIGGKVMTETMWRCDQVRAGRLYNRMMFDTREEAEQFVQRMQQMEPDQMFSIEAVDAKQVWN
jgi:hypothetical protein